MQWSWLAGAELSWAGGPRPCYLALMTAESSPSPRFVKRPWYLMAALIASWIYGAISVSEGWNQMAVEPLDLDAITDTIPNAAARHAADEAGHRWVAIKEASHSRELPLGIAKLLLGGAMVVFVAGSMVGREGARSRLVQIVAVHAVVVAAGFVLTRAVTHAEWDFTVALKDGLPTPFDRPDVVEENRRMMVALSGVVVPILAAIRTLFSLGIVLALTRPRARAFFRQAPSGPLGEG